ncbi:MAG: hypothetical protein Unbinned5350contig1004_66 [Prokaryotic dsDNA virus sp.]|nr:MAG: hypothetical protein Unbinned5350contig1004_66 [Prokaryotic dsDNA virus sp.]|tara:strand:+ start:14776 stop:15483 length:708 start_codon:yes stop_codon:yes gene_type:complete
MTAKIDLVNGTYQLIRISGLTAKSTPEDDVIALQVADDYAGELLATGLDVGYIQPLVYGQSDPNDYSGLTPQMMGPFKKLLALQLVDFFGQVAPMQMQTNADKGMRSLEQLLVNVKPSQNPSTLPMGSGNEQNYRSNIFYNEPTSDDNGIYQNTSDVFQLPIDWTAWLAGLFDLTTVTYEIDAGILLTDKVIDGSLSVVTVGFSQQGQFSLCAKATNSNGDIESYKITYNVDNCK